MKKDRLFSNNLIYLSFKGAWAICGFQEHVMRLFDDAHLESTKGEKKYFIIVGDIQKGHWHVYPHS
jgi:hypothetical protein